MTPSRPTTADPGGRAVRLAGWLALAVAATDQLTKLVVRATLDPGEEVDLLAGVELTRLANEGIAFGLFDDGGALLIALSALAFALLVGYFLAHRRTPGAWVPAGLIGGGAAGNLIDRLLRGSVTDYVDPPAWPAFNLADVAITLGLVILAIAMLRPARGQGR